VHVHVHEIRWDDRRHLTIEVKQLDEGPEALRFRAFLFSI